MADVELVGDDSISSDEKSWKDDYKWVWDIAYILKEYLSEIYKSPEPKVIWTRVNSVVIDVPGKKDVVIHPVGNNNVALHFQIDDKNLKEAEKRCGEDGIPYNQIFYAYSQPVVTMNKVDKKYIEGHKKGIISIAELISDTKGKKKRLGSANKSDNKKGGGISGKPIEGGENIILYGVPGSGKSYTIKKKIAKALWKSEMLDDDELDEKYHELSSKKQIVRVVFHPDYTYSDFTGQILPELSKEKDGKKNIVYKFRPGPFTRILKDAIESEKKGENKAFFLIIEEINRGNAAAIFGDLFQLLDRNDDGKSEYPIDNQEIQEVVYGKEYKPNQKIYIPANLWLFATMNTSDQNVFPLDTAFQRRWEMELIRNEFDPDPDKQGFRIEGTEVTWKEFADAVNKILEDADTTASGDKRLGAWFIRPDRGGDEVSKERFANKVLKYLWDDAFKFDPKQFFNPKCKTLEYVIVEFQNPEIKDMRSFGELFKFKVSE